MISCSRRFEHMKRNCDKMSRNKFGLRILFIGILLLLVALLLLFNTNSVWALITLGASIIVNTIGLSLILIKKSDQ